MIRFALHKIVAVPWVYDLVRYLAGLPTIERHLEEMIDAWCGETGFVLDLGGGTGLHRPLFPRSLEYVCLDVDPQKLHGFTNKFASDAALAGDAGNLPFADGTVKVVLCAMVSHHLPDDLLEAFLKEARRVLRPEGVLLFLDQLWPPTRLVGRLIWKYDRGTFPRTTETLQGFLTKHFETVELRHFEVTEPCILFAGKRR